MMNIKPAFVYTLVAYRSDGVDTCRGCVMGTSSSDFDLSVFRDVEELAKYWAKHRFNAPHGREFCSYEYTLLLNGCDDQHDPDWDDESACDPVTGDTWASLERTRVSELVDAEVGKLNEAHRLAEEEKAAVAENRLLAERRREKAAAEERDRKEFARLQAKFGSN